MLRMKALLNQVNAHTAEHKHDIDSWHSFEKSQQDTRASNVVCVRGGAELLKTRRDLYEASARNTMAWLTAAQGGGGSSLLTRALLPFSPRLLFPPRTTHDESSSSVMSSPLALCYGHATRGDTCVGSHERRGRGRSLHKHMCSCLYMCTLTQTNTKELECDPGGICMTPDLPHHRSPCPPALTQTVFHCLRPSVSVPAQHGQTG